MLSYNSPINMLPDTSDIAKKGNSGSVKLNYLALGDSYTIGEGVSDEGRYPSQLIGKLNSEKIESWNKPTVIARTGWTVDELAKGITSENIEGSSYDLVTLSIGVNNQYRGRSVEHFKVEFEQMLLRAITFADMKFTHVIVISIPDWGITPFANAKDMDEEQVTKEINAYNLTCKTISEKHDVTYLDITSSYREVGAQQEMLAADGLHPSADMYALWVEKLLTHIKTINF